MKLPLISYYGGFPMNDFGLRAGTLTVSDLLSPLQGFLTRGVGELALLIVDAPFTAELLHAYTGTLLPVYRPLTPYVHAKYTSAPERPILIPRSSSMTSLAKSGFFIKVLRMFAGPDFEPRFHEQDGFLSFDELANFRAVLYWPGPHSWVTMQYREIYNMNIPILLPFKRDLLLHASEWSEKLMNNLQHLPAENWQPRDKYWKLRHPYSPWPPDPDSPEYVHVNMYWVHWFDFYMPHVQQFQGIPHLLKIIGELQFAKISESMAVFNRGSQERAHEFWQDCLPGLVATLGS